MLNKAMHKTNIHKHTLFLYFSDFSKKKNYERKNKAKLKNKQTKTC